MKRVLLVAGIAAVMVSCLAAATPASAAAFDVRHMVVRQANDHFSLSIRLGGGGYCPPPAYYAPAPVYYGPPPGYYYAPSYYDPGVSFVVVNGHRRYFHDRDDFRFRGRDREFHGWGRDHRGW